jgi:lipopolysaccharide transport system permease protein
MLTTTSTAAPERDSPPGTSPAPPEAALEAPAQVTVIRPQNRRVAISFAELWTYRELFAFLVWRDIKVRYAQTALGAAWMIFQPLAMMLVYTFAFSHLARVNIPGTPYPLFALSGLTLWIFVSRATVLGSDSLVHNIPIVTKTPSPRFLIPLAAVVATCVDFLIALSLFLGIAGAVYGRAPSWHLIFAPFILFVAFLLTLGLAFGLSATNVRYRDVGQALPFLVQLWFFLSPVAYLLQTPGHSWETVIQAVNPLVGLILAFRWCLLDAPPPHGLLVVAVIVSLVIFILGVLRFSRVESTLADDV